VQVAYLKLSSNNALAMEARTPWFFASGERKL
jgi:hypothetical protein